jgi:flagellar biosynthesis protein FlhF
MKIKRYIVNNMNEAMNMIRYELGREAVIISQRKVRKPGFFGLFYKKSIEVTAAVDDVKRTEDLKKAEDLKPNRNIDVMKELENMRNAINELNNERNNDRNYSYINKSEKKDNVQIRLEENDVGNTIVKKILSILKSTKVDLDENTRIRKSIEKLVTISEGKMEGTVILIGPTGVGKTTTIAKLAGKLALIDKKKVGLLTVDTYRIGAVDQLKTYADILNLPFKVVLSIKDMEAAIENMKDCDVILIDTTGRSSKNVMQISELRAFVEKANSTSIHLVISCTTKEKDISAITEGFRELNYNNVIITKLDETTTYGSILNILEAAKEPLSYVTTGQNVPDDLMIITKSQICDLVLGEFNQGNQ